MCAPWFACDDFHEGTTYVVVGIRTGRSKTPARLFIQALDKKARLDCWSTIEWIAENGWHQGKCRKERGQLFAFAGPGLLRFPYVLRNSGRMLTITHGVRKRGQDWDPDEFDRADELIRKHDDEVASEAEET